MHTKILVYIIILIVVNARYFNYILFLLDINKNIVILFSFTFIINTVLQTLHILCLCYVSDVSLEITFTRIYL